MDFSVINFCKFLHIIDNKNKGYFANHTSIHDEIKEILGENSSLLFDFQELFSNNDKD